MNEILGYDGDAKAGAGRDCARDGDAADAGRGEGGEEREGEGEEGLGTHCGRYMEVAQRLMKMDEVRRRVGVRKGVECWLLTLGDAQGLLYSR